jgi:hypothetical protein
LSQLHIQRPLLQAQLAKLTQKQQTEAALLLDRAFLSGFRVVMLACSTSAWLGALAVLVLLRKRAALDDSLDRLH